MFQVIQDIYDRDRHGFVQIVLQSIQHFSSKTKWRSNPMMEKDMEWLLNQQTPERILYAYYLQDNMGTPL